MVRGACRASVRTLGSHRIPEDRIHVKRTICPSVDSVKSKRIPFAELVLSADHVIDSWMMELAEPTTDQGADLLTIFMQLKDDNGNPYSHVSSSWHAVTLLPLRSPGSSGFCTAIPTSSRKSSPESKAKAGFWVQRWQWGLLKLDL
jgi:hypothetical protein